MTRLTTEDFVTKATAKHGTRYDYAKSIYVDAITKLIIICRLHGEFIQNPGNHLQGTGCKKCASEKLSRTRAGTLQTFVEKARNCHDDKYSYADTIYTDSRTKVKVRCPEHGTFECTPANHLQGTGCPSCGLTQIATKRAGQKSGLKMRNLDDFVTLAIEVHGAVYNYSKSIYETSAIKLEVICRLHGSFWVSPRHHIHDKTGCVKCGVSASASLRSWGVEGFLQRAANKHGIRYDYARVIYNNNMSRLKIICRDHGEFTQVASVHIKGHEGCRACKNQIFDTASFVKAARVIHGDKFDYKDVSYVNQHTVVTIVCHNHGEFSIFPRTHLLGPGCPRCHAPRHYSKGQIQWLNWVSQRDALEIQHAENGGEYRIPGTRYSADGYCPQTNTIYEYAGTFYHSDPRVFDQSVEHPLMNMTHGENYAKTLKREKEIRALGYTLVVMWELDFMKIQKSVTTIQRTWRLLTVVRRLRNYSRPSANT